MFIWIIWWNTHVDTCIHVKYTCFICVFGNPPPPQKKICIKSYVQSSENNLVVLGDPKKTIKQHRITIPYFIPYFTTNSHQYHHPYCYLIYTRHHKKVVNLKMEAFSLTVNICINSWSNLTTRRWNPQGKLIPNIEILTVKDKASIFGLNTFLSLGVTSSFDFATFKLFSLF